MPILQVPVVAAEGEKEREEEEEKEENSVLARRIQELKLASEVLGTY